MRTGVSHKGFVPAGKKTTGRRPDEGRHPPVIEKGGNTRKKAQHGTRLERKNAGGDTRDTGHMQAVSQMWAMGRKRAKKVREVPNCAQARNGAPRTQGVPNACGQPSQFSVTPRLGTPVNSV